MTGVLWVALGLTIGAASLYAALGLTRPPVRTYVSFACMMALLAAYIVFEGALYHATTSDAAIEAVRHQVLAAHGFLAGMLVFVPAYTKAQVPRWLLAAYWAALVFFFLANLWEPYGVWFSGAPSLATSTFGGERYTIAVAPPMGVLQYAHALYVVCMFALTFGCAVGMIRRGERREGATLVAALVVAVLLHVVDVARDAVGGSWPYVLEFGLVVWALIMSIELAIDFRVDQGRLHEALAQTERGASELARTVETSLQVRDRLNTPLQTLELGLAMWAARGPEAEHDLADMRRSVVQVAELGHAVEEMVNQRDGPTSHGEGAP